MKRTACAILLVGALLTPAGAVSALQPFQMVRSLQLVQDRIASGDHAALPMQNKLLSMIDERMKETTALEFADDRNFEALLVYGMSGGNPRTIEAVLSRLHPESEQRRIGHAVLDFLHGAPVRARSALAVVDPLEMRHGLGAFVALVKGSVAGPDQASAALRHFDQARLLGQGTLVEEAAIRRAMPMAVAVEEPAKFLYLASSYVRSFLRSPYASEFAQSLVTGIITLFDTIDLNAVDDVIAAMTPEQQKVIYLRLARKGAIDGMPALSDHAASRLDTLSHHEDPRALLYAAMAALSSGDIDETARLIAGIDADRLSDSDRELLDAARVTVETVLARPEPLARPAPARQAEAEEASVRETAANEAVDDLERTVDEIGLEDEPRTAAGSSPVQQDPGDVPPEADPSGNLPDLEIVTSTRARLAEIDKLLQETTE
ncbi:MAG: chemotaxis protein MotC [Rhizobiaceae bacterium]|nr:chemotaxis protein MotC [Rhizobiaceae bacterium]MCV0407009.1 chemotaxis protein MotC [Rhizobiaceae bacterium]